MTTRPTRRIPGTDCFAETVHRSKDGSVREYAITRQGATLGHVSWHSPSPTRAGGYQEGLGSHDRRKASWPNLAAAASALIEKKGTAK